MIHPEDIYCIGKINKPHGVKGELQFTFTDDIFDRAEAEYLIILREGIPVPFFLEEYRFRSDHSALILLEGIDTQEKAAAFTNADVYFPRAIAEQHPDESPASWNYFVGFRIEDEHHGPLGSISHVDDSTANVLFEVESAENALLIPAREEFIRSIDPEERLIRVCLPEGLLDLNSLSIE